MCQFIKNLFKRKKFHPPKFSEEELKRKVRVLIIDDKKNLLDKNLKKHGWSADYIKDLDSYTQTELKNSDIICIDINGVGSKLVPDEGGMGLVKPIKELYPSKKIILYSSEKAHNIFSESLDLIDRRLYKTGEIYPFLSAIEELAEEIYNWDTCVGYIYEKFKANFNHPLTFEEFKSQLESLGQSGILDESKIKGLIGNFAAPIAIKILTHCLTEQTTPT